jgi:hypothetical protein
VTSAPEPGAAAPDDPPAGDPEPDAGSLPAAMRRQIAHYVRAALPQLDLAEIPAALRPARGWRRGAMPAGFQDRLLEATSDEVFRERLGAALSDDEQVAEVLAGTDDPDRGDQPDAGISGALLFLVRPAGWQQQLQALLDTVAAGAEPAALARAEQEIAELTGKLRRAKQRREQDLAAAAAEASEVQRRYLGTIDRLRDQLAAAQRAQQTAEQAEADLAQQVGEADRALRRLRGQLAQARAEADRLRLEHRDGQVSANSRARVLLDVLRESIAGLAEELALPEGTPAPADLVPASAPAAPELPQRLHAVEDLVQVLGLPRCHLLVDGYNLSKGLWPTAPLQQQRERLVAALGALQARTGAEVTVVFDGAEVAGVPPLAAKAVRVRFSESGELADRVLVALVAAEPSGRPMVVASSDAAVASGARRSGARTADREVLAALLPT